MLVWRDAPLRDHALPALLACKFPGLWRHECRHPLKRRCEGPRIGCRAPHVEGQRPQIMAIEPGKIENVVAYAGLTPGKFAIENRFPRGETGNRFGYGDSVAAPDWRDNRRTSLPCRNASKRMPSNLRSKIHSGPVKRSCVRVAAIGSSHSGKATNG